VASKLLSYGADPDLADEHGNTPLHLVIKASSKDIERSQGDRVEFCGLLCEHLSSRKSTPKLSVRNKDGSTPWDLTYEKNQFLLAEIIFQYGGFEACSRLMRNGEYVGRLLIDKATQEDAWDLVILLLRHEDIQTLYPELTYSIVEDLQIAARMSDKRSIKNIFSEFGCGGCTC